MGIFSAKTKKSEDKPLVVKATKPAKKKAEAVKAEVVKAVAKPANLPATPHGNYAHVLLAPRITEKSSFLTAESNAYVFNVSADADEPAVRRAIMEVYKVRPKKVAIIPIRGKQVFRGGRVGRTKSGRKAYVYLKTGDKIEII